MHPTKEGSCLGADKKAGCMAILAVWLIRLYRLTLSPVLGQNCRFYPSCSAYAGEAILIHGLWHGGLLTLKRILRCNPWSEGGYDPVPPLVHSLPSVQEHPGHHGK